MKTTLFTTSHKVFIMIQAQGLILLQCINKNIKYLYYQRLLIILAKSVCYIRDYKTMKII